MIAVESSGVIRTITLNRPNKANALTASMLQELVGAVEASHSAAAVILTGRGKVFSAGADLDAAKAGLATSPDWERLSNALVGLPGLTIAALNGTLAGGAMGMALACDLRIAAPGARFFYPVMKHGYLPQPSDPARMVALIGPARTKLMLLAGQRLDAAQALNFGLIDEIVEDGDVIARANALCVDVVAADPHVARAIKTMC